MNNPLKFLFSVAMLVLCFETGTAREIPNPLKTGTFGVCNCMSANDSTNLISLTLNDDSTFTYADQSNPQKPLSIKGKWTSKGRRLYLNASDNKKSFHRKWKYNADGQCIRSRYQLNFRRICLMNPS